MQIIKKYAYKQESEDYKTGEDEQDAQGDADDNEIEQEEKEILRKVEDNGESSERMYFCRSVELKAASTYLVNDTVSYPVLFCFPFSREGGTINKGRSKCPHAKQKSSTNTCPTL